jgi:predicted adenine nucleotide alpha hydrolase (AANH) superfamily ATPase
MLVHICCSVDSHYFLQKLREDYPTQEIIGFFYNPNIHPYSEYRLRYFDVKYSCDKLNIQLIEGGYDLDSWYQAVKGYENQPEKGDRCTICFDKRLSESAKQAKTLNLNSFTTTLLMSPQKSQEKLDIIGKILASQYNLQWIFKDYRSNNGTAMQSIVTKENSLYRQNYCGCIYGLIPQRKEQKKLLYEMIDEVSHQIQPASIEERLQIFHQRNKFQEQNIPYKISKVKFLNYRLLRGFVELDKHIIPSYILPYSTINRPKIKAKIIDTFNNIHFLNKDEIKFITLDYFNKILKTNYDNVYDLYKVPPKVDNLLTIRKYITNNDYDISCIIVLDSVVKNKNYTIFIDSQVFMDSRYQKFQQQF